MSCRATPQARCSSGSSRPTRCEGPAATAETWSDLSVATQPVVAVAPLHVVGIGEPEGLGADDAPTVLARQLLPLGATGMRAIGHLDAAGPAKLVRSITAHVGRCVVGDVDAAQPLIGHVFGEEREGGAGQVHIGAGTVGADVAAIPASAVVAH